MTYTATLIPHAGETVESSGFDLSETLLSVGVSPSVPIISARGTRERQCYEIPAGLLIVIMEG